MPNVLCPGLGTPPSPQIPHSSPFSPPPLSQSFVRFDRAIGSRRNVNSAHTTNSICSRLHSIPSRGHGSVPMISTSKLSQASLPHDTIGNARYATHHSEDSSISSPGLGQPEQGQVESSREDDDQPSLKRRISEVDSQEGMNTSSKYVRRRISRACDQCNQLRTKCNGGQPCLRCKESNFECKYARQHKKRGRAPKKDYPQSIDSLPVDAKNEATQSQREPNSYHPRQADVEQDQGVRVANHRASFPSQNTPRPEFPTFPGVTPIAHPFTDLSQRPTRSASMSETAASTWTRQQAMYGSSQHQSQHSELPIMEMNLPDPMSDIDRARMRSNRTFSSSNTHPRSVPDYPVQQFLPNTLRSSAVTGSRLDMMHLVEQHDASGPSRALAGDAAFMEQSPASPAWLNLPSPPFAEQNPSAAARSADSLRYPVLKPLLPLIESVIPRSSACDLLDVYFTSSSSAQLRPLSPHILGHVFRKKSFLHPTRPRVSSPALLASMLWIAAQTSNAAFLNSHPAARGRVCRKLLELTVDLLKPLIHSPVPGGTSLHGPTNHIIDDVSLGVLGVSTDHVGFEGSITAHVDVLATYIHLATVVSASERKAASLRWWGAAWSIARELKFGREAPASPPQHELGDFRGENPLPKSDFESDARDPNQASFQQSKGFLTDNSRRTGFMTEEDREERRRVWWLLYMMDRHLALCYNRPLALLDNECEGLLQPMDDTAWQSGQFPATDPTYSSYRRRGPSIERTGQSIFGYFLPLMTILGNIVQLNQSRNRPTFGTAFHNPGKWDDHVQEITHQLELYGQSLQDLEFQSSLGSGEVGLENRLNEAPTPSVRSASTNDSQMANELSVQKKTTVAYGTHIMHVLHILLAGKWDPITLLDDNDLWISTQGFLTATDHAIAAASAVSGILEFDPDLSFMPFFFGVYLLQGSFLLLLFADKLQGDVSPDVVKACETVIRAHEACVVTLDTQYQRNFRKVMRSALAQVRGRMAEDLAEQQHWRREVLSLYRWTGDGTGLAL